MEDWLKPLDAEKLGLSPKETKFIQDDKIGYRGEFGQDFCMAWSLGQRDAQNVEGGSVSGA